ncbi:exopolysaccharide biosynthesis polyprenyl glycosylphosphotransferase [Patescibacteria group bacterium]|nr:exopolysaccharide biosynthesis polyprenyl glycosylphosphotransferase [Patescibacteria group bacterium]
MYYRTIKKLILLTGDVAMLYSSLYITLLIRYWSKPGLDLWQKHCWLFTIIFIVWIFIFYIADLYNLNLAVNNIRFIMLTSRCIIIAGLFSVIFFYLIPQFDIAPKTNLFLCIAIFIILFFLWRKFFNWILEISPKNNIIIIGINQQVYELIEKLRKNPRLGFNVLLIINNKQIKHNINNIPVISDMTNLKKVIIDYKINTVVLAADPRESHTLRSALFQCMSLQINYTTLPHFYENVTGKIPVKAINEMWFLENLNKGEKKFFNIVKRSYDIILALLIFIITCVFWPIIAFLIKIESKGPVFITMKRAGKNNREFRMFKFRTMKEESNNRSITIKNDPRITKFGSFLRKTRIDEIPQVLNILKGEMSFVGPRPERPELIKNLEKYIPFYKEKTLIKPGVTGWDQISGEYHSPSHEDTLKKLQYDLFYIKNRSIYLDLSIMLKTISTVLSRKGR